MENRKLESEEKKAGESAFQKKKKKSSTSHLYAILQNFSHRFKDEMPLSLARKGMNLLKNLIFLLPIFNIL